MKILKISGCNLNSLRGAFTVDFESPPLRDAGLFAITGPTGAGKSTLLDAVTLALYGRAARYGAATNPENVMSRHCGECSAEVEFEIPSGRHRATWSLHRARKKPDGAVQAARRYVYDANGTVMADQVRTADECVEKLTGLDYDRFLRSVLLAQGEFARFLKARDDERAALLESLTGTEIYSALGALAFEEHARRQAEIEVTRQGLDSIVLLGEDERRTRENDAASVRDEHGRLSGELAILQAMVDRAARLETAKGAHAAAHARLEKARANHAAAASELARLQRHAETLPYAADLLRVEESDRCAEQADRDREQARAALDSATPEYTAALLTALESGERLIGIRTRTRDDLKLQEEKLRKELTEQQSWIDAHSQDEGLAGELPDIARAMEGLIALRRSEAEIRTRRCQRVIECEKLTASVDATAAQLTGLEAEHAGLVAETTRRRECLNGLLEGRPTAEWEADRESSEARLREIDAMLAAEDLRRRNAEALAMRTARCRQIEDELAKAQGAKKTAEAALAAALREAESASTALEEALLVANLAVHRSALREGVPCPLCGSREHPSAGQAEASAELEQAKARSVKARAAHHGAAKAAADGDKTVAVLASQAEAAQTAFEEIGRAIAAADESRRSAMDRAGLQEGADLEAARADAARHADGIRLRLKDLRAAEDSLRDQESLVRTKQDDVVARRARLAADRTNLDHLAADVVAAESTVQAAGHAVADAIARLAPRLEPFGVAVPDPDREDDLHKALSARAHAHRQTRQLRERLEKDILKARADLQNSENAIRDLETQMAPLRRERTSLDPSLVESRMAVVRRALPRDDSATWTTEHVTSARSNVDVAQARYQDRQETATKARADQAALTAALGTRLAGGSFASVSELKAARLSDDEAARIERIRSQLESAVQQAEGALAAGWKQAEDLRAEGAEEGAAADALRARHSDAGARVASMLTRLGGLEKELQIDEENRKRHAGRQKELETLCAQLTIWTRLKGLIGSKDGALFRRYAQGLSLDVLVQKANRHLARLSDRYRLRRAPDSELRLEIVDQYQGSVSRPMESLSGGETFLASLALALGLSDLAGRNVRIDSLFIDEGFGALDPDTLDVAISALETMQQDRKTVGVISHVELLRERIAVQISVEKGQAGMSAVRVGAS